MLKLMKYEFRKQAFSKLVILILVGLIELLFIFGIITGRENILATSMGLLGFFTFGAMFFLAFESIITYSNDLKQKCSYMLFLTPNTSYSIVGAKVISAGLQIILSGIAFFAVFAIDGAVLLAKYSSLEQIKKYALELINQTFKLDIQFSDVASLTAFLLLSWISVITVAFFSITLSTTFLANKKYKGILSFVIFIALNYLYDKICNLILGNSTLYLSRLTYYFSLNSILMAFFIVLTYVGTAWMLEKKVSV